MKKHMLIFLSILSISFAQEQAMPTKADMDKMMAGMQEMQACMAKVDMNSLKSMQEGAVKIKDKVEAMCLQGKRDEAQKEAIAYAKKMMKMPAIIQMKKCTAGFAPDTDPVEELKKQHVCDGSFDIK